MVFGISWSYSLFGAVRLGIVATINVLSLSFIYGINSAYDMAHSVGFFAFVVNPIGQRNIQHESSLGVWDILQALPYTGSTIATMGQVKRRT